MLTNLVSTRAKDETPLLSCMVLRSIYIYIYSHICAYVYICVYIHIFPVRDYVGNRAQLSPTMHNICSDIDVLGQQQLVVVVNGCHQSKADN